MSNLKRKKSQIGVWFLNATLKAKDNFSAMWDKSTTALDAYAWQRKASPASVKESYLWLGKDSVLATKWMSLNRDSERVEDDKDRKKVVSE